MLFIVMVILMVMVMVMVMVPSTSRLCLSVGVSCFRLTMQENSPRSSRVTPRTTNSEPPETTCDLDETSDSFRTEQEVHEDIIDMDIDNDRKSIFHATERQRMPLKSESVLSPSVLIWVKVKAIFLVTFGGDSRHNRTRGLCWFSWVWDTIKLLDCKLHTRPRELW